MVKVNGLSSKGFVELRQELEPVALKVPKGFSFREWQCLSVDEKSAFVRAKKDLFLKGFSSRLDSPVLSLLNDLSSLDVKLAGQEMLDSDRGESLSELYLKGVKLKIDLAKALKDLGSRDSFRREQLLVKSLSDDEVFVVDPEFFSKRVEDVDNSGLDSSVENDVEVEKNE